MREHATELLDEPRHVETVICQHLVVGPALRKLIHANSRNVHRRSQSELRNCGRNHLALAAMAAHAGWAAFAFFTASSTSSRVDRATSQSGRPVAGFIFANDRPTSAIMSK